MFGSERRNGNGLPCRLLAAGLHTHMARPTAGKLRRQHEGTASGAVPSPTQACLAVDRSNQVSKRLHPKCSARKCWATCQLGPAQPPPAPHHPHKSCTTNKGTTSSAFKALAL
jgi:hypothetical protein